ncbi:MAG: glycosyltransferase family 2 protein [Alphaproteobacteria bacterium]|nr:glycosyltransferase family 2 protein [Alphaproteobacteria bacterium]
MPVKVSIIIPVFNVAPYLTKCMESVCAQTLSDIEIIAVNDASTDNSLEILQRFEKQNKKVTVINHATNTRTASCRNDGLDLARGEYVCFLDGDDYLDVDFCEKLYNLAKKEKADIAKGVTKTFNTDGSIVIANDNEKIISNGKFAFMGHLLTGLYNRKFLTENNIRFHVDFFCFQIQAVYFANKVVCDNSAYYNYVRHENSCDSDVFSLDKWVRLNLGHANFIYDWVNTHDYPDDIKQLYLDRAKGLCFYGFNKLAHKDIVQGCKIMAKNMAEHYNCGYQTDNQRKLSRKLFRHHPKTTKFGYIKNRLMARI